MALERRERRHFQKTDRADKLWVQGEDVSDDFGDLGWLSGTMGVLLIITKNSTGEYHCREMMTEAFYLFWMHF